MVVLWGVLAVVWIALFVFLGISTLRRGHWVMFIIGIFLPLFWIIGALIPPTEEAVIEELSSPIVPCEGVLDRRTSSRGADP